MAMGYGFERETAAERQAVLQRDYSAAQEEGAGWIGFAAVILALTGLFNGFEGLLAITRSHVFAGGAEFVFSNLRTWGWIVLGLGIVQVAAAFGLTTGRAVARWFAIACAGLNAIGQLLFAHAFPFWTIAAFTLDILVIYALTARWVPRRAR
jgi:hypothetical protein